MVKYFNDPLWIIAKFNSKCSKCGEPIKKGDKIYYYPRTKDVYSGDCAKHCERDFIALSQDEDVFNSKY